MFRNSYSIYNFFLNPEPKEEASISPPPSSEPVNNSAEQEQEPEPGPDSAPEPGTQEATPEAEPVTEQPQKKEENGQAADADKAPEKVMFPIPGYTSVTYMTELF